MVFTCNTFGKGRAYYLGLPSGCGLMDDILDILVEELSLTEGPDVPEGVMARQIDDDHALYLNMTDKSQEISVGRNAKGLISGKEFRKIMVLPPFEAEFIENL